MNSKRSEIMEDLTYLHKLMHRRQIHGFMRQGPFCNPHRGQGRVLSILKLKPEINQRELLYLLDMSKQALAELLTKLEKAGYIERFASGDDKRALTVKLTEKGKEAADKPEEEDYSPEGVLEGFSDKDLNSFGGYLKRIIAKLEENFQEKDGEQDRIRFEFLKDQGLGIKDLGRTFDDLGKQLNDFGKHFTKLFDNRKSDFDADKNSSDKDKD